MTDQLRILSLGAGVQSTTLAIMSARGDLPAVNAAIFEDKGWEPAAVYKHLDWLETVLPFPVYRVSAGNLRTDTLARTNTTGGNFAVVPWFTLSPKGKKGMGRRQCTKEYKLRPLQRKIVELLGGKRPKAGAEVLIGISTDEAWRMKPSRVQYIVNHHPLLDHRISRRDCIRYLEERQISAPKSACTGCPFHDLAGWRALTPAEFADAVLVDEQIRHQPTDGTLQFMHPSIMPLADVDFETLEEKGQGNLFLNECEGMCGV